MLVVNIYVNSFTDLSLFIAANQVSSSSADVRQGVLHNDGVLGAGGHSSREQSSQCVVTSEGNTGCGKLQIYRSFVEEQHFRDMALSGYLPEQRQGPLGPYKGMDKINFFIIFNHLLRIDV